MDIKDFVGVVEQGHIDYMLLGSSDDKQREELEPYERAYWKILKAKWELDQALWDASVGRELWRVAERIHTVYEACCDGINHGQCDINATEDRLIQLIPLEQRYQAVKELQNCMQGALEHLQSCETLKKPKIQELLESELKRYREAFRVAATQLKDDWMLINT